MFPSDFNDFLTIADYTDPGAVTIITQLNRSLTNVDFDNNNNFLALNNMQNNYNYNNNENNNNDNINIINLNNNNNYEDFNNSSDNVFFIGNNQSTTASNVTTTISQIRPEIPIWLIPCYSILLLAAIVGNLLVISTLVQNRRMRTITNLFLLNLAISDILLGVLCMPVTLVGTLLRRFIFGEFLCKLIQFSQGISEEILRRFSVVLKTISSCRHIKVAEFDNYCIDTAKLYVELYGWYHMPPSVHKVLIHAPAVVKNSLLPLGQLSEEVLEATHKVAKEFRLNNARKMSRITTNEDVFNRWLLYSDPKISSAGNLPTIKTKHLPEEVLALLEN